jgi:hypothetical protein
MPILCLTLGRRNGKFNHFPSSGKKQYLKVQLLRCWLLAAGKTGSPAEIDANLGDLGMGSYKPFGILVEGWGRVARKARLSPESPRSPTSRVIGEAKPLTTKDTKIRKGKTAEVYAELGCSGMNREGEGEGRDIRIGRSGDRVIR